MRILVVNCGSSSIKYSLFDLCDDTTPMHGTAQRIGERESRLEHHWHDAQGELQTLYRQPADGDHRAVMRNIAELLRETDTAGDIDRLSAIGHRVVHGGEPFDSPALIDAGVVEQIRGLCDLAPLHTGVNLMGIEVCSDLFPGVPQVAVFDTAFHQSLPAYAYRYPVPDDWYRSYGVRRYGFHGSSHAWVARRAVEFLNEPAQALNLITLHLGNGASAAAIRGGRCIDTSMGFTPLEGLMMGTRSGDIDPGVLLHVARHTGAGPAQLESALNTRSGFQGICGDKDMREIERRARAGDEAACLAIDMYCYRIKKYIGAYYAVLGQVDALVFTAGIGENAPLIRQRVCAGLENLGIGLDEERNRSRDGDVFEVQRTDSTVKILVIATHEEMQIAQQTAARLTERA